MAKKSRTDQLLYKAFIRFQWYDMETTIEAINKQEAEAKLREDIPEAGSIHLVGPGEEEPPIDYLKN